MTASKPKAPRVETLAMTRAFDKRSADARAAGLCRICAPTYSYMCRDGAGNVNGPCIACEYLMEDQQWGSPAGNGWRKPLPSSPARRLPGDSVAFSAPPGIPGTIVVLNGTDSAVAS